MAHQAIESSTLRLRNLARTFFGTGFHALKKVCHNGGLLTHLTRKQVPEALDLRDRKRLLGPTSEARIIALLTLWIEPHG